MFGLTHLFIFILGLIVGSFLNVVIYRYNTGLSVIGGRSRCLACARDLRWFELIPVFSFLFQRGRCTQCGSKISWQYPAVELVTGLLFVLTFQQFILRSASVYWLVGHLIIFSLLTVITVYDLRHKIIPDGLVYTFILLSLLLAFSDFSLILVINHLLAGFILFVFFFLLWWLSRGRWMGFGDAKLALGVGFLLGLMGGVSAIVFAFWLGAVVGLLLIILARLSATRGSFTIKSEIPFAPFIIIGLCLNFFLQLNVVTFF